MKLMTGLIASVAAAALGVSFSANAQSSKSSSSGGSSGKYSSSSKWSGSKNYQSTANPRMQKKAENPFSGFLPSGTYLGVVGTLGLTDIQAQLTVDTATISRYPGGAGAPAFAADVKGGPHSSTQFDQAGLFSDLKTKGSADGDSKTSTFNASKKMDNPMALGVVAGYAQTTDSGVMFGVEGAFDMYLFKNIIEDAGTIATASYLATGTATTSAVINSLLTKYHGVDDRGKIMRAMATKSNTADANSGGTTAAAAVPADDSASYLSDTAALIEYFGADIPKKVPDGTKFYKRYTRPANHDNNGLNGNPRNFTSSAAEAEFLSTVVTAGGDSAKTSFEKKFSVAGHGLVGMQLPGSNATFYGLAGYGVTKYDMSLTEVLGGKASNTATESSWLGSFRLGAGAMMKWSSVTLRAEYIHAFKSDVWKPVFELKFDESKAAVKRTDVEFSTRENLFRVGLMIGL